MCKGLPLRRHNDVSWEFSDFEQTGQLWASCGMYFQGDIVAADGLTYRGFFESPCFQAIAPNTVVAVKMQQQQFIFCRSLLVGGT